MAKGLTGIEYGKLKVYGETTNMSEVLKTFAIIMKKFGYPEDDLDEEFDLDEVSEEDIVNELKEEGEEIEKSQPWTREK